MIQVNKTHYNFSKYASKQRWASYWHQIDEVLKANPSGVLVVGVGDGIVPDVIQSEMSSDGKVYKFDFDEAFEPDFVGDLRNIKDVLTDFKVDCTLCSQVLEHVEFEYVDGILEHLASVSRDVIISVPHNGFSPSFHLKLPKIRRISFSFRIPFFYKQYKFNGEHYWELGAKGYSKKRFIRLLSKYFTIESKYHVPENPYHVFFILKSKIRAEQI